MQKFKVMEHSLYLKDHTNAALAVRLLISIIAVMTTFLHTSDAQIGVNYGLLGSNLPPPEQVLELCTKNSITRIRIFEPNPSVLQALSNYPSISVIVGVPNQDIPGIANDINQAQSWVQNNILKYKNVNIRYVVVGNEISPLDAASGSIAPFVAPAMQRIHTVIMEAGLNPQVKVSTAVSSAVLGTSYPPSAGEFNPQIMPGFMDPIIKQLVLTKSPLLVNVYPYFAHISDPENVKLDFAVFKSSLAIVDGNYMYFDLFSAMVDSFYAALDKAGGPNLELVVTETGWPSAGGTATSIENAYTYNSNLINAVRRGTPRRPNKEIETYIFDLIDEDQKSPELEKHWGLFLPNKEAKYPISFS